MYIYMYIYIYVIGILVIYIYIYTYYTHDINLFLSQESAAHESPSAARVLTAVEKVLDEWLAGQLSRDQMGKLLFFPEGYLLWVDCGMKLEV